MTSVDYPNELPPFVAPVVVWCGKCQARLPDDALFCPICGGKGEMLRPVSEPQSAVGVDTAQQTIIAPKRFVPPPVYATVPKQSGSTAGKVITFIVLGFFSLLVAIGKGFSRSGDNGGFVVVVLIFLVSGGILYAISAAVSKGKQ